MPEILEGATELWSKWILESPKDSSLYLLEVVGGSWISSMVLNAKIKSLFSNDTCFLSVGLNSSIIGSSI